MSKHPVGCDEIAPFLNTAIQLSVRFHRTLRLPIECKQWAHQYRVLQVQLAANDYLFFVHRGLELRSPTRFRFATGSDSGGPPILCVCVQQIPVAELSRRVRCNRTIS